MMAMNDLGCKARISEIIRIKCLQENFLGIQYIDCLQFINTIYGI